MKENCCPFRFFWFMIFLTVTFFGSSHAQTIDSLQRRYEQKAIWLHEAYYVKNNTRFALPLLDKELFPSPVAYLLYKEGIGSYRWGRALGILGTAANIGALVLRNKDPRISNGVAYSGVGLNLIGLYLANRGRLKIERAVFTYNQDLLFSPYFRR